MFPVEDVYEYTHILRVKYYLQIVNYDYCDDANLWHYILQI